VGEQLGQVRQKQPESMHLLVVAPLMILMGQWRCHMTQGSDFYVRVDWPEVWPSVAPLIFACLPYCSSLPSFPECDELLEDFRRDLLGEAVWQVSWHSLSKRGHFAPCKGA
jgi:hypothetical protein